MPVVHAMALRVGPLLDVTEAAGTFVSCVPSTGLRQPHDGHLWPPAGSHGHIGPHTSDAPPASHVSPRTITRVLQQRCDAYRLIRSDFADEAWGRGRPRPRSHSWLRAWAWVHGASP